MSDRTEGELARGTEVIADSAIMAAARVAIDGMDSAARHSRLLRPLREVASRLRAERLDVRLRFAATTIAVAALTRLVLLTRLPARFAPAAPAMATIVVAAFAIAAGLLSSQLARAIDSRRRRPRPR